jgi:short-subunit dehydrogenase
VPRRDRSPVRVTWRPWAVVTGASSGIGRALAAEAAARGCNVVLVARREAELSALGEQLERQYGVETRAVALCLARPESAEELHTATASLSGVEFFVANAGRSWFGPLVDQPLDVSEQMLALNVATVTRLCRLYASDFARQGRGAVLVTSSLVSLAPLPHAALYGASRAFVRSLAHALREECAPAGVVVASLMPGATATEFAQVGGIERVSVLHGSSNVADWAPDPRLTRPGATSGQALVFNLPLGLGPMTGMVLPPATVATAAFDGLAVGSPCIVPGFLNRVYAASTRLMTERVRRSLMGARAPGEPRSR